MESLARPKVLLEEGERKFIAKFSASNDLYSVVKAEFIAMRLADEVGLDIAQVHLRRALGKDVLLIERFDRVRSDGHWHRRAMVSALTIFEFDEMMAAYASYEKLRVFRILCFCNLLGVIELGFKSNHKLTHGLFPVLNGHRPALADIA